MEACTFRGNSALGGGGGIFSAVNISERTLTFIENTARYGNNSATPPETLVFTGGCAGQEDDSAGGASDAVVCRIHASSGETMRPITVRGTWRFGCGVTKVDFFASCFFSLWSTKRSNKRWHQNRLLTSNRG